MLTQGFQKFYGSITKASDAQDAIFYNKMEVVAAQRLLEEDS